ncbi:U-box domain-containing protein [Musa troglodytarum]|nr:U-box domain-containing protein [Musa troglodytarum]
MDDLSALMDLVVGVKGRARKNIVTVLLNLVKNNGDKTVRDVKEVDGAKATVMALVDDNSKVSTRGKSKVKMLSRVLKSGWGSQL